MNDGAPRTGGYTIVEVLIVLAVTMVMLASMTLFIRGRYNEAAFASAIREVDSKLQDIMNDVTTGLSVAASKECSTPTDISPPTFSSFASPGQGQNKECIYIGRVLQFGIQDSNCVDPVNSGHECDNISIYRLVGRRTVGSSTEQVSSLQEALPVPLVTFTASGYTTAPPDHSENIELPGDLKITKVISQHDGGNYGALALTTTFGGLPGAPGTSTGQQINSLTVPGSKLGQTKAQGGAIIFNNMRLSGNEAMFTSNPNGIDICFAGYGHKAGINIGNKSRSESLTQIQIDPTSGVCST